MSTINEVMGRVDRLTPNAVEERDKARWLLELDGRIYAELTGKDDPETEPARSWPEDGDKELLAAPPYDNIYDLYLQAMIAANTAEYEVYNNVTVMFLNAYQQFAAWYRRGHMPEPTYIKGVV